jgi:hypothetical protein
MSQALHHVWVLTLIDFIKFIVDLLGTYKSLKVVFFNFKDIMLLSFNVLIFCDLSNLIIFLIFKLLLCFFICFQCKPY